MSQLLNLLKELNKNASPTPWKVLPLERNLVHVESREIRNPLKEKCDGIRCISGHNHSLNKSCYQYDCPMSGEDMIVETDSGFYGPKLCDANLIVEVRNLLPQIIEELEKCSTT